MFCELYRAIVESKRYTGCAAGPPAAVSPTCDRSAIWLLVVSDAPVGMSMRPQRGLSRLSTLNTCTSTAADCPLRAGSACRIATLTRLIHGDRQLLRIM